VAIAADRDGAWYPAFFSSREWAEGFMSEQDGRFTDDIFYIGGQVDLDPLPRSALRFIDALERYVYAPDGGQINERVLALSEHLECGMRDILDWLRGTLVPSQTVMAAAITFTAKHTK